MIAGRESFAPQFKLETALKDAELIRELAAGAGVELPLLRRDRRAVCEGGRARARFRGHERHLVRDAGGLRERGRSSSRLVLVGRGLRLAAQTAPPPPHLRPHAPSSVRGRSAGTAVPERCARSARPRAAYAALAPHGAVAYRAPGGASGRAVRRVERERLPGVFGVLAVRVGADCRARGTASQLPIRPNGATGWIRASALRAASGRRRASTVDVSAAAAHAVPARPAACSRRRSRSARPRRRRRPAATT